MVERITGTLLGTVDGARADSTVHDGAVYLHLGEQYLVGSLDLGAHVALVEPFNADYYTQVKKLSSTRIVRELMSRSLPAAELWFGEIEATEQVIAYQRSGSSTTNRSTSSRSTCPRAASRPRRSGSSRPTRPGTSTCWARCTRPSTR